MVFSVLKIACAWWWTLGSTCSSHETRVYLWFANGFSVGKIDGKHICSIKHRISRAISNGTGSKLEYRRSHRNCSGVAQRMVKWGSNMGWNGLSRFFFRQPQTRHIIVKNTWWGLEFCSMATFCPRVSFFHEPNHGMGYMNRQPDIDVYIILWYPLVN